MLLQQTVLILVYGTIGAAELPDWVAVLLLCSVAVTWLWNFIIQQPHAVAYVNSLRAACGAVFAWGVACYIFALIEPGSNFELAFFLGSALSVLAAHAAVGSRRRHLLMRLAQDVESESSLSLWCRVRLQLAFQIHSRSLSAEKGLWLAGATLAASQGYKSTQHALNTRNTAAATEGGGSPRSALALYLQQASGVEHPAGLSAVGANKKTGPVAAAPSVRHDTGSDDDRGSVLTASYEDPQYRAKPVGARAQQLASARSAGAAAPALAAAKHPGRSKSQRDQYVFKNSQPSSGLSSALVQLVHEELARRNSDAKLSAPLLILLADIRKQFLSNRFMELMALSQAQKHASVPWDVQFWVTQRIQILRSAQESSGAGGLSPVERLLFDQHYEWAIKYQKAWYRGMVEMWQELKSSTPDKYALQAVAQRMARALADTEHSFRQLMDINKNSVKVLKAYGNYLLRIRRSEAEGVALLSKAERLEATALERSQREVSHFKLLQTNSEAVVVDETAAVVVVNGELSRLGEITAVNAVAASLFKRPKHAMIGKNIATLIPSPVSDVHDRFLRAYAATGRGKLMNETVNLLVMDGLGVMIPVRGTLRESPPLEGSSAPQFTMLMQPLRVTSEHHILFAGVETGYQITAADADSYRLMGVGLLDLQQTPVSATHFFPAVDQDMAALIDRQSDVVPAAPGSPSWDEDDDWVPPPAAAVSRGGSGGTSANTSSASGRLDNLLLASDAFICTPVRNTTSARVCEVFGRVQTLRLPHAGVIHVLSWKHTAAMHGSGHGGTTPAHQVRSMSIGRRTASRALSDSGKAEPRDSSATGAAAYAQRSPAHQGLPPPHQPPRHPAAGGHSLDMRIPVAVQEEHAAATAQAAEAVHWKRSSARSDDAVSASTPVTLRAEDDDAFDAPSASPVLAGSPDGLGSPKPSAHGASGSSSGSGDSKLLPSVAHAPDMKLPTLAAGPSASGASASEPGPVPRNPLSPGQLPPPVATGMYGADHHSHDSGSVATSSVAGSQHQSYAGSSGSAGSRHSSMAKAVLNSSMSTGAQHPAVRRLQWTFMLQLSCLLAFAIAIFVLRLESVRLLELFVDGMRNAGGRLLHAQASIAIVSSMVLANNGLDVERSTRLSASLQDEMLQLQRTSSRLQNQQAELSNTLGPEFALPNDIIRVSDGQGGSLLLQTHDVASWMQAQLQVIQQLPPSQIRRREPVVAGLLNSSDIILETVFPNVLDGLEDKLVLWLEDQEQQDLLLVVLGLVITVGVMGAAAMWQINTLATHRHSVLDAIAAVPLKDVGDLGKRALLDAKNHLTLLLDADHADNAELEELEAIDTVAGGAEGAAGDSDLQFSESVPLLSGNSELGFMSPGSATPSGSQQLFSPSLNPSAAPSTRIDSNASGASRSRGSTSLERPHNRLQSVVKRTVVPLRALGQQPRRRRHRVKKRKGALRDSSCFECSALGKLMAPTIVVFAFIAGLWGDWVLTTERLLVVSERTFASEAFAVRAARGLRSTYRNLLDIPDTGSLPGANERMSVLVDDAILRLSRLVGGTDAGSLTGETVPALQRKDDAFSIIQSNACAAESTVYPLDGCAEFQSGLLATAGLRGGLLRFASSASSFASQLAAGDVRGGNATAMAAARAAGDEVAFIQAMAPRGSIAFNTKQLLHRLVFPYMLGVSNRLAGDFQQNGRDIHGAALVRSQALTGVMMAIMVLSTALWVWPGARRLGRDVYATHALLAAVPPDVQKRVMALHTVLHRIATMASKATAASSNSLSDMGALMDMDELMTQQADDEDKKTGDGQGKKDSRDTGRK